MPTLLTGQGADRGGEAAAALRSGQEEAPQKVREQGMTGLRLWIRILPLQGAFMGQVGNVVEH